MVKRLKTLYRKPVVGMTPALHDYFESGISFWFSWKFHGSEEPTEEEAAEAWEIYREEFVEQYAAENPGKRPWAWWKWSAPDDSRRVLGVKYTPFALAGGLSRSCGAWESRFFPTSKIEFDPMPKGSPSIDAWSALVGERVQPCTLPMVILEPEHEFLSRHGLLFEGEAERVAAP